MLDEFIDAGHLADPLILLADDIFIVNEPVPTSCTSSLVLNDAAHELPAARSTTEGAFHTGACERHTEQFIEKTAASIVKRSFYDANSSIVAEPSPFGKSGMSFSIFAKTNF